MGSARVPHGCRLPQWGHREASVLSGVAFPLGAGVTRLASLTPKGVRVMGWGTGGPSTRQGALGKTSRNRERGEGDTQKHAEIAVTNHHPCGPGASPGTPSADPALAGGPARGGERGAARGRGAGAARGGGRGAAVRGRSGPAHLGIGGGGGRAAAAFRLVHQRGLEVGEVALGEGVLGDLLLLLALVLEGQHLVRGAQVVPAAAAQLRHFPPAAPSPPRSNFPDEYCSPGSSPSQLVFFFLSLNYFFPPLKKN